MLKSRLIGVLLALGLVPPVAAQGCGARDFLSLPLDVGPGQDGVVWALETAYPDLAVDPETRMLRIGALSLPMGDAPGRPAREVLANPSVLEQFQQTYPLPFDLALRTEPWFDPGRARNDAFFRALYGGTEAETSANLVRVDYPGAQRARFAMTTRHCVATQLDAALRAIAAEGPGMDIFFRDIGGSYNWRVIAGTARLSAHSFGIAVDFNTKLGGYWRWSGAQEGNAGAYNNRYPEELVRQMERFGFIWGGKWHHFDGMHFEYRPELILHARVQRGF